MLNAGTYLWLFARLSNHSKPHLGSFKSSENIQKKKDGSDRYVSNNQFSSVTLDELAMEARENIHVL